jgi:hypothetical protein
VREGCISARRVSRPFGRLLLFADRSALARFMAGDIVTLEGVVHVNVIGLGVGCSSPSNLLLLDTTDFDAEQLTQHIYFHII